MLHNFTGCLSGTRQSRLFNLLFWLRKIKNSTRIVKCESRVVKLNPAELVLFVYHLVTCVLFFCLRGFWTNHTKIKTKTRYQFNLTFRVALLSVWYKYTCLKLNWILLYWKVYLEKGFEALREKCPNTELFLVRIFLHSD